MHVPKIPFNLVSKFYSILDMLVFTNMKLQFSPNLKTVQKLVEENYQMIYDVLTSSIALIGINILTKIYIIKDTFCILFDFDKLLKVRSEIAVVVYF